MRTFSKFSPLDGILVDEVQDFTAHDVDKVLSQSVSAQKTWKSLGQEHRRRALSQFGAVLEGHKTSLVHLLHREQGKPEIDATQEVELGISQIFRAAEINPPTPKEIGESESHRVVQLHEPVGIVAAILPWNYPVYLALDKIARSLAFGNAIVIKPSPHTPLATRLIGAIADECELIPEGLVQVITGADEGSAVSTLGSYLTTHPAVNKIAFVGSTVTGVKIREAAAKAGMKRVVLEMGGNDPALVLPDAEVEAAAKGVAEAALINNGQICVAIKRVYVHERIFDEFVRKIAEVVEAKVVGKDLGPMNNKMQYDKVIELIEDAVKNHAKVVTGGVEKPHNKFVHKDGLYIKPTVLVGLDDDMRIVKEEQFGPVIPILMYRDVDEAVTRCNATIYGLGASVWGTDVSVANQVAEKLEAGIVWVNEHAGDLMDAPQGGVKMSGLGRESDWGLADLTAYTESKIVKYSK